jgi:large subunit ribosomal protein L32
MACVMPPGGGSAQQVHQLAVCDRPLGAWAGLTQQGATMAVQQNKKSPSKRGMHRSHNALAVPGIAVEPTTGETHLRHHISPNGVYRGRQVVKAKTEA